MISINVVTLLYLVASVCFIQALKGLSHPTPSRLGNAFGMIGMVIGIFFGWFLSAVAARLLGDFHFILSFSAIALAVGMAVGTGLIFGLYPARRAALLSPMEALRYE